MERRKTATITHDGEGRIRLVCVETPNTSHYKEKSMSFLAPENQQEGQGLLDDVDVSFQKVRVVTWDYNGKVAVPVPALCVTMEQEDGAVNDQYYSLGKATDWQPNEDGTEVVAVGKATGITNSSNAALLINSLVDAGFPTAKITDDVRFMEGIKVHMSRIPAPKRGGTTKAPRADGRVFEDTVLVISAIIAMPGAKAAPKGKPATAPVAGKAATPKTAPTAAPAEDLEERCSNLMMEILAENPAGVKKAQIPGLALKKVAKDADKNAVVARMYQDDFLNSGAWTFDKGVVTL